MKKRLTRSSARAVYGGLGLLVLLIVITFLTRSTLVAEALAGQAPPAASVRRDVLAVQEIAEDETHAAVDLQAGFLLDPYLLRVVGGGTIEAATLSDSCTGYVKESADVVLNWSGDSDLLHLLVYSDGDPVLVVRTPDGEVVCNDDASDEVIDPFVTLGDPVAGAYELYVGSYRADEPVLGFLVVTELTLDEEDLAGLDLMPLLDRRAAPEVRPVTVLTETLQTEQGAIFGTQELSAGFGTITEHAAGGGDVPVFALEGVDAECTGFASLVPSFSFDWMGASTSLTVFFEGQEDSSLVVVTPEGELICNSNASEDNLNPMLELTSEAEGQYDVYIASFEPDRVAFGELTVTEETGLAPETLSPPSR